jgi:hypothetical protein
MVHEYIHTLMHSNYYKYVSDLDKAKRHILVEGIADYLKSLVASTVDVEQLRKAVEGPFYRPNDIISLDAVNETNYPSEKEAEMLAGVVGLRNVLAAYFLGHVELIGGPANLRGA